jgi:hypothetical protein
MRDGVDKDVVQAEPRGVREIMAGGLPDGERGRGEHEGKRGGAGADSHEHRRGRARNMRGAPLIRCKNVVNLGGGG